MTYPFTPREDRFMGLLMLSLICALVGVFAFATLVRTSYTPDQPYVADGRVYGSYVEGSGKGKMPGRVHVYVHMENGQRGGINETLTTGTDIRYCPQLRSDVKVEVVVNRSRIFTPFMQYRLLTQPCVVSK